MFVVHAQELVPMNTWRVHLSYNAIHSVAVSNSKIYGASSGGVMVLDRRDGSISTYHKLNGLSSSDISALGYASVTGQLIIGYSDGDLDIIRENLVTNFDRLKTSAIAGSKRINFITARQSFAYLSSDYGVVVFDLQRNDVKETWRDLGAEGAALKIRQAVFAGDSVFLATERGVLAGDLSDNLLDYRNWRRFQDGEFNTEVQSIALFNNNIYAAIEGSGLYRYENGMWTKELFLEDATIHSLSSAPTNLFIAEGTRLWTLTAGGLLSEVVSDLIVRPNVVQGEDTGEAWIGDASNGLVSYISGDFISYLSNGPAATDVSRLQFVNNEMIAMRQAYTTSFLPMGNQGQVSVFSAQWSSVVSPLTDITDITSHNGKRYASSFGQGVQAGDFSQPEIIYNEGNSTLINLAPGNNAVYVTALASSSQGLWVANYGVNSSLHLMGDDGAWQPYSFIPAASRYPEKLLVDLYGNVWMLLSPSQGGGVMVFNREKNVSAYLTDQVATGGMPSRAVRSMALDKDGFVWVGTDKGVAYFPNPAAVFGSNVDAVEPIFENRFLLSDERITAIAIDGGNRKWIGTERGVWLFRPAAEEVVYNFTAENSPLLSNRVYDIEINEATGEVFFVTSNGVVSFRSDATESGPIFQNVKIFPNPVTAEFTGTIGISGLATDAVVKITDVSGKLIWQTRANGGTATWNGRDYNGRKAATGIYLVFSATQDGVESYAGKIAVVE